MAEDELAQYSRLIRQYLTGILGYRGVPGSFGQDDSDEETNSQVEQVESLKGSQLEHSIRLQTGCFNGNKIESPVSLLHQRQRGLLYPQWNAQMLQRFVPTYGKTWATYRSRVFCGKYSRSGELFMSASQDRCVRLYNSDTKKQIKEIQARDIGWSIIDTDFSSDQRWLIYSSWSPYIHLCNIQGDVDTHEPLDCEPDAARFCLFSVKFSPDSHEILGGSSDQNMYIYNLERKEVEYKVEAHSEDINTVTYVDEDSANSIITAGDDCLCKVWDRRNLDPSTPRPTATMRGHYRGITHVSSKGDGRYFISNGKDQTLRLWDIRNPSTNVMTYTGHQVASTLIRAYFSPVYSTGQKYVYSGSHSGHIYVWEVLTGELVKRIPAHSTTIRDVSWHPYDPTITSTSWDAKVKDWTNKECPSSRIDADEY